MVGPPPKILIVGSQGSIHTTTTTTKSLLDLKIPNLKFQKWMKSFSKTLNALSNKYYPKQTKTW
jgi:hypothetical protein